MRLPFTAATLALAVWLVEGWAFGEQAAKSTISSLPATIGVLLAVTLAAWAASSVWTMRRLATNDFGQLFNPRDSLEASLCAFAGMLRSGYRAESCIVVVDDAHSSPARIYIADASRPVATPGAHLDERLTRALLAFPPKDGVVYERRRLGFVKPRFRAFDAATLEERPADGATLNALRELLEAKSFISLPLRSRARTLGRVYLVSPHRRYAPGETAALAQLMAQAGPLIENVQLVEQLALTVARQERRRISRDLHDSTIQPYIGLKLGLEALRRTLPSEDRVAQELDELIGMAGEGISQLRQYVGRLKSEHRLAARQSLVQAVRAQVHRFGELYAIQANVVAPVDIPVSGALCDEIVHIVREGLSNIRRHTEARRASVALRSADGKLFIEIVNDGAAPQQSPRFNPRSISERVRGLGGHVAVGGSGDGDTIVAVEIPL